MTTAAITTTTTTTVNPSLLRRSARIRNHNIISNPEEEEEEKTVLPPVVKPSTKRRRRTITTSSSSSLSEKKKTSSQSKKKVKQEVSPPSCEEVELPISSSKLICKDLLKNDPSLLLMDLGSLVEGVLVKRPSASIRSPYVADVKLHDNNVVLAHAPALDVGGLCSPGCTVLMKERDITKGGGSKTSHSIELVVVSNDDDDDDNNEEKNTVTLVGAHPRLGEVLAERVLELGLLESELGFGSVVHHQKSSSTRKKKRNTKKETSTTDDVDDDKKEKENSQPLHVPLLKRQCTYGDSRVDFEITLTNNTTKKLVEVKNVVCADYSALNAPDKKNPNHCVVIATNSEIEGYEYKRTAIFPWGRVNQMLDGKKVVSARAIKHLRNLVELKQKSKEEISPIVMFVVNRSDCHRMRACHEACPLFAQELKLASQNGVQIVAFRVHWTTEGKCYFDGIVPVHL